MLVLTRRAGESIVVQGKEGDIWVSVLQIKGKQVRLGVLAGSAYRIHRKEVADRIAQEKKTG